MGINDRGFLYIDKITSVKPDMMTGFFDFNEIDAWEYIESAAQLCSLHVRWFMICSRHSFLLKVNRFKLFKPLKGEVDITAELLGCSSETYKYSVKGSQNNTAVFKGVMVIGTVDYSPDFNREEISNHYKGVLECLMKDMTVN